MKKVFCIIPAWNEEKNIAQVATDVLPEVDVLVVVDDGSGDSTFKVAQETGAVVLCHAINRGQGAALQTGNEYAIKNGADVVVHFDADGQFLFNEIKDVVGPVLSDDCDVVFGSRFLGKESQMPFLKKNFIMPIARLINYLFFGVKLTDPQSGFRAFSSKVARDVEITQDGMAHCSEIMSKVFLNNFRVKEVPITVLYFEFGQRFGGGIRIVKDLIMSKMMDNK